MGDVIGFPGKPQRTARQTTEEKELQAADRAAHGCRVAARLKTTWMLNWQERKDVARALHGVLERVEQQHGIRKADVLRAAKLNTEGHPTKHLSQYTLPRDLPEDEANRRSDRLRKKAESFARIARAAAVRAGLDEHDLLSEVFASVALDVPADDSDADLAKYEQLADTLRLAMDGIARRLDLAGYFRSVQASGLMARVERKEDATETSTGLLQPKDLRVVFNGSGRYEWNIQFRRATSDAAFEFESHIVCYPSVSLGEWGIAHSVPLRLVTMDDDAPRKLRTKAFFVVELRLCLVPLAPDLRPTPALRVAVRANLDPILLPAEQDAAAFGGAAASSEAPLRITFDDYWQLPLHTGAIVTGIHAGRDTTLNLRVDAIGTPLPALVTRYFDDVSRNRPTSEGVRFFALDARALRDWLAFDIVDHVDDFWFPREECHAFHGRGEHFESYGGGYSPFAAFSLAAALDRSLWEAGPGVVDVLADQAEQLTTAFHDEVEEQAALRHERLRALARRWTPESDAPWLAAAEVLTRRAQRLSPQDLKALAEALLRAGGPPPTGPVHQDGGEPGDKQGD